MTIAPRTALGRLAKAGARKTAVARTRAAVTMEATWDFAPAASAVAVCERLASDVNPPNSPAERFAAPSASSSWSASIS